MNITSNGICIPKALFKRLFINPRQLIEEKLTIVENVDERFITSRRIIRNYKFDDDYVYLPRIFAHMFIDNGIAITSITPKNKLIPEEKVVLAIQPYKYQSCVLNYVLSRPSMRYNLSSKCAAYAYIVLPPGLGKSFIGCMITSKLRLPTLVIVPTEAIREQWHNEFAAALPLLTRTSYMNKRPVEDIDITIIIVNTAIKQHATFFHNFGIVIIDEVHEYGTERKIDLLWHIHTRYLIGLSATPNTQLCGLSRAVNAHIGLPIITTEIPELCVPLHIFYGKVYIIKYKAPPELASNVSSKVGVLSTTATAMKLLKDSSRTQMIVDLTWNLYHKLARTVFVFAESREYLINLKSLIIEKYGKIDDITVLRGGSSHSDIENMYKSDHNIILTTYSYSGRGLSVMNATAIIQATPRKYNMEQLIGRIERQGSDKNIERIIIDIVDMSTFLKCQLSTRKQIYKIKQYIIHEIWLTTASINSGAVIDIL